MTDAKRRALHELARRFVDELAAILEADVGMAVEPTHRRRPSPRPRMPQGEVVTDLDRRRAERALKNNGMGTKKGGR